MSSGNGLTLIHPNLALLPNYKSLEGQSFAVDIINVTENLKFVLRSVKNIVGKGENAGYFSLNVFKGFLLLFLGR